MELCTLPDALNIWQAVLKVWLLCNQHLHPCNYEQEDCSMLEATVHQIFHKAQQDPQLQHMIDNLNPKYILACPM